MAQDAHRSGLWAMKGLWKPDATEKCQMLIPDTVFLNDQGQFETWLFVSKSGRVVRKRSVDASLVKNRLKKLSNKCLVYFDNGTTGLADCEFLDSWLKTSTNITAVQSVTPGPRGKPATSIIHRCKYEYAGNLEKPHYHTTTHALEWLEQGSDIPFMVQSLTSNVKCRAKSIHENLCELTFRVVRFLEKENGLRLKELVAEFVIDQFDTPILSWIRTCKSEGGENAQDQFSSTLRLDHISSPNGLRGRRKRGNKRVTSIAFPSPEQGILVSTSPRPTSPVDDVAVGMMLTNATSEIELGKLEDTEHMTLNRGKGKLAEMRKGGRRALQNPNFSLAKPHLEGDLNMKGLQEMKDLGKDLNTTIPTADDKYKYPNPFKCHGDFCSFVVNDPSGLMSNKDLGGTHHIMSSLFSDEEQSTLAEKAGVDLKELGMRLGWEDQPSYLATQHRHFTLTLNSIATARKEKRGVANRLGKPTSTESKIKSFQRPKNRGELGMEPADAFRDAHGGIPLSMYYQQVNVCENCFRVYTTLDKARELMRGQIEKQHNERTRSSIQRDAARDELIARLNTKRGRPRSRGNETDHTQSMGSLTTTSQVRTARKYMQEVPTILSTKAQAEVINERVAKVKELEKKEAGRNQTTALLSKISEGMIVTREESRKLQAAHADGMQTFDNLDGYLRGTNPPKYREDLTPEIRDKEAERKKTRINNKLGKRLHAPVKQPKKDNEYRGHILLIEEDEAVRKNVVQMLSKAEYVVTEFADAPAALELCKDNHFDLMLVATDLPTLSGVEVTKLVRKRESRMSADLRRLAIVAFTHETSPEDLRVYMEVGMDGCVSKPVDKTSLLNTLQKAIPHHRPSKKKKQSKKEIARMRPTTTGLVTSSDVAKLSLPVPSTNARAKEDEATSLGVFQIDADTSIPYVVMGKKTQGTRLFNFVVVNDFFDTYETMQIFFRPIVTKYPGMQVLVFNLPGQAFTEWRRDVVLNNDYYIQCLEALLRHVDYNGTKEFETRGPYATPFYSLGFGNGANICTYHALRCKPTNLRAVISLNGFTHIDPHLAGVLHDCMNVFSCSPPTRPDLPVYFYTRFLFSSAYLTKVSTPLALNLYTAVHNPISLDGRMQICKGSLAHVDFRPVMNDIHQPIIIVQSSQGGLVKPVHVEPYVQIRGGEVRSIRQCLKERRRPCVIWLRSGHEVFQECRKPISDLIEQLATGYHEKHDVTFLPTADEMADMPSDTGAAAPPGKQDLFEDRFIDNVLGTLQRVRDEDQAHANPFLVQGQTSAGPQSNNMTDLNESENPEENPKAEMARWSNFRQETNVTATVSASNANSNKSKGKSKFAKLKLESSQGAGLTAASFDPTKSSFDMYQKRSKNDSDDEDDDPRFQQGPQVMNPADVPEVREYMQWRIARNRKRLATLVHAASCMQRAWRAYMARTMVTKMRRKRAALFIQTRWRAKLARDDVQHRKREEWACRVVQRCWRGKAGREKYLEKQEQTRAARQMQRVFRGKRGKNRVQYLRRERFEAARMIQRLVRSFIARLMTWHLREQRNAATDIQRAFRGHRGRIRAGLERDKYLFSKAQSQGIEFGRQMLLEHKLHGTRLQSEVSLLTREKVETEEKVEALLSEIAEFDKGVRGLEKEMHELTAVETEAKGVLDEEARVELREQKMRLDREFGVMLGKIADRKERLQTLEVKLQTIDRTRQGKEEELRDLERKLVVLLEEQQQELEQIKKRQESRGELLLPENTATLARGGRGGGGGDAIFSGPTPQQQQQANNMMQSTESLMKFGFMSMSLTYFSSLNMIRAMRKVGALNTVLNGPGGTAAGQDQLQALMNGGAPSPGMGLDGNPVTLSDQLGFKPKHKKGEMPEQQELGVSAWTVDDVGDWLATLKLEQYRTCFADAAIDGGFLYDLNDDDLRNTLGIEHNLHRKKILNSITRLRRMEEANSSQNLSNTSLSASTLMNINAATGRQTMVDPGIAPAMISAPNSPGSPVLNVASAPFGAISEDTGITGATSNVANPEKLSSMVRHGKLKELKPALANLPDTHFDENDVQTPYIQGFGTQYSERLNRQPWFINKADEHGNTLFLVAAQNGRLKVAQFLFAKGANPNHQNNQGQTALHYCMNYSFYDFGAWLTDASEGAGANDTLTNMYDLTCYDGLTPED